MQAGEDIDVSIYKFATFISILFPDLLSFLLTSSIRFDESDSHFFSACKSIDSADRFNCNWSLLLFVELILFICPRDSLVRWMFVFVSRRLYFTHSKEDIYDHTSLRGMIVIHQERSCWIVISDLKRSLSMIK